MKVVRVAICQIEAHPALYLSHIGYLEEPFVPVERDASLGHFATNGVDVDELQQQCKESYVAWAGLRIQAILARLSELDPKPGIVLFPEASIALENLLPISKWSATAKSVVLAGTHTPQGTVAAKNIYKELGIDAGQVSQLTRKGRRNVLPLFSSGKLKLIPKTHPSAFEHTIVRSSIVKSPLLRSRTEICGGTETNLVPLICSEALAAPNLRDPIDLIAIVSFDAKPEQFQAFCNQQVQNKRTVLYCNDGSHGHSRICAADDRRSENWLAASFPDGLPSGDAYLVADIDLDVSSVEVATARPSHALTLVQLQSVIAENSPAASISAQLGEIALIGDAAARAQELQLLAGNPNASSLQRIRVSHLYELEKRGVSTSEWWPVIGKDCVIPNASPMRELEAILSATCREHLVSNIESISKQGAELQKSFVKFLAECQRRSDKQKPLVPVATADDVRNTINRDDVATHVYRFIDNPRLQLLEVSGLSQIGKSAALEKALAQASVRKILRIPLNDSSSPDYLLYSIIRHAGTSPAPPYADPIAFAAGEEVARVLRTIDILLLSNAQDLLEYGAWRDSRFRTLIAALVKVVEKEKKKLVIETQRELPLELPDSTVRARLRITGLQAQFASALFDGQLRRVGLAPNVVTDDQRDFVVQKLGGHPVAIAIAADAIYESGAAEVVALLKKRQGFFLNFLRTLIGRLHLADEEQTLLRVLCLSRNYVPRQVMAETVSFNAAPFIRNLLALGALELGESGTIRIAPILRDYFHSEDLPRDNIANFHRAAAEAFAVLSKRYETQPHYAVESDYHGRLAGAEKYILPNLVDGALAVAKNYFVAQKYDDAYLIVEKLLQHKNQSLEVVRLSAQIQARRNKFQQALELAKYAFAKNRNDTWLLSELAKIALTLSRDDIAEQLIAVAENAAVEDTSIWVVKGRMALRRKQIDAAAKCFERAKQLTERNAWPFFFLGRVYLQLGRIDDAIDVLYEGEQFVQDKNIRTRSVISAIRTQLALCYLFSDRLELAEPIILRLWEEERSPEVVRAYAALTIKKKGISEAHEALKELERAEIKSHYDRCQFHLLYGLFYLGINDASMAAAEFQKAHKADKTNVFVMSKLARTLMNTATELWTDGSDEHRAYVNDCTALVKEILGIDSDNADGLELMQELRSKFGVEIRTK